MALMVAQQRAKKHLTQPKQQSQSAMRSDVGARSIIDDTSIDPEWRDVIRHYSETNDPWGSAGNWINTDRLYSSLNGGEAVNAGL